MRRHAADLGVTAVVALLILGPLLVGGGYWLFGDMVFVPRQPWKPEWLGLDGALPRAVPMDALVSLATYVVPGQWVQKGLLLGGFLVGGIGAARLVREQIWVARAAAITLFCWNPWVHERLLIGQWAILLGYLLLPWVALAALRIRRSADDWGPAAVVLVGSAICSPSSGVMALGVVAVLGLGKQRRAWWRIAAMGVVANLPWLLPALTADSVRISTDGVFGAFAARAESGAGALPSIMSLGGIWKTSILAGERTSGVVVLLSCALSVAALAALWRREDERRRWCILGGGAVALALLPATGAGAALLESLGSLVPGVALLRDSHRFLAPLGLVLAVGVAAAVSWMRAAIRPGTGALWSAIVLVVVAPVLLLPNLGWGGRELMRSSYPQAWQDIAARVGGDDVTVVLPWSGSYRGFSWNDRRAVLDPAPRMLPGSVLVDDSVVLQDMVVPPEDPRVVAVAEALQEADPGAALRAQGVRWVLVEEGVGLVANVPAGRTAFQGHGLSLIDLSASGPVAHGPTAVRPDTTLAHRLLILSGHGLAILLLFLGGTWILRSGSNERHTT